jgi:UDP-N-acetylmuramate dehydrogenase
MHCLDKGWFGLENLSLIPGNVGASPMQNIGAYGVEIGSLFESLEAWDKEDRKVVCFYKGDCHFGYRESYFKKEGRGRFVILRVTFRLSRKAHLHTAYGAIGEELARMGISEPGPRDVSNAVIHIRRSKLPDPKVTGNAGSFFKNPTVPQTQFDLLKKEHPEIVGYPTLEGGVKLAAGWLIERSGWKGFRRGDAGCHPKQALVLVNYGEATGQEIWKLSQDILDDVQAKFGVHLEREVNIY